MKEIAEVISTDDLKARITRLRHDSSRPLSARDECEVYGHIRRLKKEFQEEFEDPFLIHKEVCSHETIGEEGSYVHMLCVCSKNPQGSRCCLKFVCFVAQSIHPRSVCTVKPTV